MVNDATPPFNRGKDHDAFDTALKLCVRWNSPELVRKVMAASTELVGASPEDEKREQACGTSAGAKPTTTTRFVADVTRAMQHALEQQQQHVFTTLLELSGITIDKSVSMLKLYLQQGKTTILTKNKRLQRELRKHSRLDFKNAVDATQSFELYQKLLTPAFHQVDKILSRILSEAVTARAHDVFFWLCFQGNTQMAKRIWEYFLLGFETAVSCWDSEPRLTGVWTPVADRHCDKPIHVALLGYGLMQQHTLELKSYFEGVNTDTR
eukprot:3666526-Prymnesium_polylepis.2